MALSRGGGNQRAGLQAGGVAGFPFLEEEEPWWAYGHRGMQVSAEMGVIRMGIQIFETGASIAPHADGHVCSPLPVRAP